MYVTALLTNLVTGGRFVFIRRGGPEILRVRERSAAGLIKRLRIADVMDVKVQSTLI